MQATAPDAQATRPTPSFQLSIPPLKVLTSKEDLALARAAYALHPNDARLRYRLAKLLSVLDHFEEALAVLEEGSGDEPAELFLLSTVLLNRERPEDDLRALDLCERAAELSTVPRQLAEAQTQLAKAQKRVGKFAEAKISLEKALSANPYEKDAYKRLFRHHLEVEQDPQAALHFAETTIANGIVHARVLGSWVLGLAKLGRLEEAHQAEGLDRFLMQKKPEAPTSWESQEAFNAALTEEALHHPDMRYERYGTASAHTWRLDEPALKRGRAFAQLQELIASEVQAYVALLSGVDHPFAAAIPEHARLRNWCVITEGSGYETPHVHQNGWLSGVYYIHVQDHIANGTGPDGCIAFGLPDFLVGEQVSHAYGEQIIRPHTGLMILFPSHVYHHTFPHHGEGKRICYAFDIVPSSEPLEGSRL